MPSYCVAFNCNSQYGKVKKETSFHKFPMKNPKLLARWVHAVRRKDWQPTIHSKLCSKHFTPDSFSPRPGAAYPLLKDSAIPSVFDFPPYIQKVIKQTHTPTRLTQPVILQNNEATSVNENLSPVNENQSPFNENQPVNENQSPFNENQSPVNENQSSHDTVVGQNKPSSTSKSCTCHACPFRKKKQMLEKKVHRLQAKLRRRDNKINSMRDLINQLKKEGKWSDNCEHVLTENSSD